MSKHAWLCGGGVALAALVLLAAPAAAGSIGPGIDVFTTPDDGTTTLDFGPSGNVGSLPADFFCTGSAAFTGKIAMKGAPLATNPANALGSTDTVIYRSSTATFDGSNAATATIRVVALSLVNSQPLNITCSDGNHVFGVRLNIDPSTVGNSAYDTTMSIQASDSTASGGTFSISSSAPLQVPGKLTFTSGSLVRTASDTVNLSITGTPWSSTVGTGGITHTSALSIDTTGGGTPDTQFPGTNGFAPGWQHTGSGCPCPVPIQHVGPHPPWPLPKPPACSATVKNALARAVNPDIAAHPLGQDLSVTITGQHPSGTVAALHLNGTKAATVGTQPGTGTVDFVTQPFCFTHTANGNLTVVAVTNSPAAN